MTDEVEGVETSMRPLRDTLSQLRLRELLKEVQVIREKSPAEGKLIVRRIEGTLNRLEAMAKCAKDYNVGFYFF